jgi:hypothetical protein
MNASYIVPIRSAIQVAEQAVAKITVTKIATPKNVMIKPGPGHNRGSK